MTAAGNDAPPARRGGSDGQPSPAPGGLPGGRSWPLQLSSVLLFALVIWILNAELPPGINESHYLTKAKAAWDPSFAPGDLFLSSGNAHWLFAQTAGWMSTWLPLSGVAWLGRLVCWLLMAWAWQRSALVLRLKPMVAACLLAGWMLATRWGNWAGEWAIGGFEAKSVAYPFIMFALAGMLAGSWRSVWIFSAIAIAWHPLVGIWAGSTLAMMWLFYGRDRRLGPAGQFLGQLPAWMAAAAIAMIGILPAVAMLGGPDRQGEVVVAQIHAFYRLSHHQTPHLFWWSQHAAGATTLVLLIAGSGLLWLAQRSSPSDSTLQPAWRVVGLGTAALLINAIGLAIDLVGSWTRPDLAASLLRFYWFRWADIIVPLAWLVATWTAALHWQGAFVERNSTDKRPNGRGYPVAGTVLASLLAMSTLAATWQRVSELMSASIAPADRTILMSDSPELSSGPEVVDQWIETCRWVRENSPADALFLTPRAQQTFKWYAHRAEVVTFKDVPQDGRSLVEWFDRVGRCSPPRDAQNRPLGWTTQQILRLHKRYAFDYIIVDRRIQREPPLLELVYPQTSVISGTYAIFKLPRRSTH